MRFRVVIERSDDGVAVSVPGLPGCRSLGRDEREATDNITAAIRSYLASIRDDTGPETRTIEIPDAPPHLSPSELRQLPRAVQDAIIEAQAAEAEHEYRTNPDLMVDFDEIAESRQAP